MKIQTCQYRAEGGFSPALDPGLDSERTLVLVFAAPELADTPALFTSIRETYPKGHVIGYSTAGEISGTRLADHSLSVAVMQFATTTIRLATAMVSRVEDSYAVAQSLANQLDAPDLKGVLVLSDGLHVNGSELARGFRASLGAAIPVTGGLAADGPNFKRTWVMVDGQVAQDVVAAVGLYGDAVTIGHGSQGGWDIFGPERVVTKAQSNVLYELDGKPALALYKHYLGDRVKELPAAALLFPLALRASDVHDAKPVVRTILGVDEAAQSMTFAGDIPEGSRASLMYANLDRLIQGASQAASGGPAQDPGEPTLAIAISCIGRRLVLGDRTEEEIEATLEALPAGTSQVGFYSYGELCPQGGFSSCELHNQTMTLTTISERV